MEMEDWNGERFVYNISYRRADMKPPAAWETIIVEDQKADHTVVQRQPPFRKYEVIVMAKNELGLSLKKPIVHVGYSGEDG